MNNNTKSNYQSVLDELDLFKKIFDSFMNGALITDSEGYITHFNKPYGDFIGVDYKGLIGKHCTEAVENTRMHIVAKTGIPEINRTQLIKGQNIVVHRIPIRRDSKVIAVFGMVMFQDLDEITKLAEKTSILESKVKAYEQELRLFRSTRYTIDSIIGKSTQTLNLKNEALKATSNSFPVLITGESGTGKELYAQSIHHGCPRNIYPFMRINCAAIPKDLLESELFGYDKGAFTGANTKGKPGKFELAHRGTVFLDEVGDLPLEMQPKLLRVLEEKEFERVGGNTIIKSDFRLIAATNRNLEKMMSEGLFRKDLFYRMNVIQLNIAPLRDRKDDIIPIANHLLEQMSHEMFSFSANMETAVRKALLNYSWPGNIRELSNVLERSLASMEGKTIRLHNLPLNLIRNRTHPVPDGSSLLRDILARAEKDAIIDALKETEYNKVNAARMLGIHRTLLYKKMNKYEIALDSRN